MILKARYKPIFKDESVEVSKVVDGIKLLTCSCLKAKVKGFSFGVELSAVSLFGVEAEWVSSYIIVIVCSQIAAVLFCSVWS